MTDRELLASTVPFDALDAAALDAILLHLRVVELRDGETLFRQGDVADALFVLTDGRLDVLVGEPGRELRVSTVSPGRCVGEFAFFESLRREDEARGTRTATVRAQAAARLLELPAAVAGRLLQSEPAFRAAFTQIMDRRLVQLRTLLAPLFGELPDALLHDLQDCLQPITLAAGDLLFRTGDPGDAVFLLLEGRLQAFRETAGDPVPLRDLGPGELVGEIALLTGDPRTASVRATRDSSVARLSAKGLLKVLHGHPEAHFAMTRQLARRIAHPPGPPAPPKTFALVPAHPDVDVGALAQELSRHLPGSTLVIDAARFDAANGKDASRDRRGRDRSPALAAWLARAEQSSDFLLLVADAQAEAWTLRCLRQADHVLLVGRTGDDPAPGPAEQRLLGGLLPTRRGVDRLVLLHAADTQKPTGTARWLERRPRVPHHHVRRGDAEQHARLARYLTGRAVGLALGGGGARGFAHAGVLVALRELGIPVDCFGGTSMGAGLAAAGALELDRPRILAQLRRAFIDTGVVQAWTIPLLSILDTRRLDEALVALGEQRDIEDLWVPYFAVSTNLTAMSVEIHERGPLWLATRASSSMPMVFPPVFRNGDVLVDGGLLDNLPVTIMRERCPRFVIACDVVKPPQTRVSADLLAAPSGWKLLWQRLTRRRARRPEVPSLLDVATYSLVCASVIAARHAHESADVVLRPDVTSFRTLEFAALDELVKRGYDHTMQQRERLLQLTAFARLAAKAQA